MIWQKASSVTGFLLDQHVPRGWIVAVLPQLDENLCQNCFPTHLDTYSDTGEPVGSELLNKAL